MTTTYTSNCGCGPSPDDCQHSLSFANGVLRLTIADCTVAIPLEIPGLSPAEVAAAITNVIASGNPVVVNALKQIITNVVNGDLLTPANQPFVDAINQAIAQGQITLPPTFTCADAIACIDKPGTINLTSLQPGTLPSGILLPASQIVGSVADSVSNCAQVYTCIQSAPAGTVPLSALGSGPLPSNVIIPASAIPCDAIKACISAPNSVPPNSIGSGPLNSTTTVSTDQIVDFCPKVVDCVNNATGKINPAVLAAGSLPAGVTIPISQVLGTDGDSVSDCLAVLACVNGTNGGVNLTSLAPGVLPDTVKVDPVNIEGLCNTVLSCISAAPAGSIPVSAIASGAPGEVLQTLPDGTTGYAKVDPATSIGDGALNPNTTVSPSQIDGFCTAIADCIASGDTPIPASAIQPGVLGGGVEIPAAGVVGLCEATYECMKNTPAGIIPATAITPSATPGEVLQTLPDGTVGYGPIGASAVPCSIITDCFNNAAPGSLNPGSLAPITAGGAVEPSAIGPKGLCVEISNCLASGATEIPLDALADGPLPATIAVDPAQIVGFCEEAIDCLANAPAGSLPASVLGPIDPNTAFAPGELSPDVKVPCNNIVFGTPRTATAKDELVVGDCGKVKLKELRSAILGELIGYIIDPA